MPVRIPAMKRLSLLGLVILAWTIGCERPAPAVVKNARSVMGTFAEVTAVAPERATAQRAVEAAYTRLNDVNRLMSDYVADSEVGRLNALPAGDSLVVSPETFHCLEQGVRIAELSGGAFDMTCRPLVALWKQAGKDNRLPADADIQQVLARVGRRKLRLDPATRRVSPAVDGMQIDLGGIAKGYALDLAAEAMRVAGATGGLVDVGGDVVAFGPREDGRPWRVGVKHPFQAGLLLTLSLRDRAVATSGVQQRFNTIAGRRYSHIVDPRTGRPAEQAPAVTVIAPDGLTADAWATAFSVLSVDEGAALLEQTPLPGVEVMWVLPGPAGPLIRRTEGFAAYLADGASTKPANPPGSNAAAP